MFALGAVGFALTGHFNLALICLFVNFVLD
jgi:hypothetical protein